MSKQTISVRVTEQQNDGIEAIANEYGVTKSDLFRGQIRQLIENHEDVLEDYMILSHVIEEEQKRANPYQRVSHMPNNLYNYCVEQIDEPYPTHPQDVIKERFEPYKKAIQQRYEEQPDRKYTMLLKLRHAMRMYEVLHPTSDSKPSQIRNAVIHYAISILEKEDMETARAWVSNRIQEGTLKEEYRDDVFDAIRDKRREEWQTEWKTSLRAKW